MYIIPKLLNITSGNYSQWFLLQYYHPMLNMSHLAAGHASESVSCLAFTSNEASVQKQSTTINAAMPPNYNCECTTLTMDMP